MSAAFLPAELASFRRGGWRGLAGQGTYHPRKGTTTMGTKTSTKPAVVLDPKIVDKIRTDTAAFLNKNGHPAPAIAEVVDRPAGRSVTSFTADHRLILDTLTNGKAVKIAVPEGTTAKRFDRATRKVIMSEGRKGTLFLRRVFGAGSVTFWCVAPKAKKATA